MLQTDQVGIIGAGELGKALGHVLEKAGSQVLYYDKQDDRTTTASIGDVVAACSLLLICVPSWANRDALRHVAKHIDPQNLPLVLSFSKGVEDKFVTMDQVLAAELPKGTPYGLVYGPMLANELVAHMMASGVLALSDPEYGDAVRNKFAAARIYLEQSDDMRSTAMCGVLKNVYAIAFGVCDGLKLGANARGRLMVMIVREMRRVLESVGANSDAVESLAGIGDLVASGIDQDSFNYRVGRSVAEAIADVHLKSEGTTTLKALPRAVDIHHYPVAELLFKLLFQYGDPRHMQRLIEV